MTVAFGTSNYTAEAGGVNTTYVAPSGITDGDLLLVVHFEYNGSSACPAATPPVGGGTWTVPSIGTWPYLHTDVNGNLYGCWMWQKIASGESGNYTFTHATTVAKRGMIVRVTGADGTTPIQALTQNVSPSSFPGGGPTTFLTLTTTVDQELILVFGPDDNDNGGVLTEPTGTTPTFTKRIDDNHGNFLATGTLSPAGATGNKTMTNNSGTNSTWFGFMVAVQPPTFVVDTTLKPGVIGEFDPDVRGVMF